MRSLTLVPQVEELKIDSRRQAQFEHWLYTQLVDAKAARMPLEALWREILRQYDAVPKTPIRNVPVEDASNIEVPLGAIATEGIYSQMIDLIFTLNQPITVRHNHTDYKERAKAMQKWVDILQKDVKLRIAAEHSIMDVCQLGTGYYYTPFVEEYIKHRVYKIKHRGPVVYSMLPDDVLLFGGPHYDVEGARGAAIRFYLDESDLNTNIKFRKWAPDLAQPCAGGDWLHQRRARISRVSSDLHRRTDLYEIHDVYVRYDIDNDGIDEDLLVHFDMTSHKALRIRYNPYDTRPLTKMVYQVRSHMPNGLGPMEMTAPFQVALTDAFNNQIDNTTLANMRMFKSRYGAVQEKTISIWSGRNLEMINPEDLMEFKLADIYPSLEKVQDYITSLAERRTGANELTHPNQNQTFGNRTPVGTSQSLLQQANRRFTPSFDAVRLGTAHAMEQAIMRGAERVRAGDVEYIQHLMRILGPDDASKVIDCLHDEHFSYSIGIHMTASSNAINRDADRQNAMMLAQTLAPYYEKMLMLVQAVVNPMTPPEMRSVALKICAATSELVDRIIRTFEQFKDPESFIVDPSDEIQSAQDMTDFNTMMQLGMMMGGGQPGAGQQPGAPGAPALPAPNGGGQEQSTAPPQGGA